MGFMTGQRFECQDCDEIMVIPLEFDTQEDYQEYLRGVAPKHPNLANSSAENDEFDSDSE